MKLCIVEPFYGGSHRYWADSLKRHLPFDVELITLPARFWKWRMQMGAVELAEEFQKRDVQADLVLCSDMVDLPTFAGLLREELSNSRLAIYFHENQFAYPWSEQEKYRVAHRRYLGQMNIKSALVADRCFFNSQFNLDTFLSGIDEVLKESREEFSVDIRGQIIEKSVVLPLGIDVREELVKTEDVSPKTILWNHRWEEDKDPNTFFQILFELSEEGVAFQLIVLGEQQDVVLPIFAEAKERLREHILHFGYVETREEYFRLLSQSHLLPVTSKHDFFGLSVLEATAQGVFPLLPRRLAYPELFTGTAHESSFYETRAELKEKLRGFLLGEVPEQEPFRKIAESYSWEKVGEQYKEAFSF